MRRPYPELRAPLLRTVASLFKQMLSLLLVVGLAVPVHSYAVPSPASDDRALREQRLTQTLESIADLRQSLNRAEFDTKALLDSLDYDPEAIIDFVRNEIRFEPYEGLLRGAQGTLMSRAGNALDQSLLLTVLLRETGVDARLAYGVFDEQQAKQFISLLRDQDTTAPARALPDLRPRIKKIINTATADDTLTDQIMQLIDNVQEPQEHEMWASAETGRDYLLAHLGDAEITLEPTNVEPQLAQQSTNYFWVEYKDGAADPWQRIHVIPAGDAFDESPLAVLEYLTDEVPERFQHRLRLTAKLEREVSGKTEIVELMQPWERPVANMTDKRLSFANQPNGVRSQQDLSDLGMIEASTTFLIPTLNDAPAPGAQAFDLRGRTVPLSTLQMDGAGAAAVFQTVSDKTLDAADALAGLSIGKPKAEASTSIHSLRRVWLEYTSIHPNGTERVDERTIWQAPAAMSPAAPAVLWELATPHGIGVFASQYPASYLLDLELRRLQAIEPVLRWSLAAEDVSAGQPLPSLPNLGPAASGFPELSYLTQFDAGIDPDASTVLAYRAEPTIVVTRHGLRNTQNEATSYADVDIIHNRRTVLRMGSSSVQTDPLQAMRLGAWETLVEQIELERRLPLLFASSHTTLISANRMYQEPQRSSQAPLILQSAEGLAALPADSLDGSTRLALEQDLQRGYVVVMETPARAKPLVWWRVNPKTGETLGRGLDGRGQITAESATTLIISAKVSSAVGIGMCYGASNSCSFAKCFVTATAVTMGVGGTALLATAIGGAWGLGIGLALGLVTHPVTSALPGGGILPTCFFR